MTDTLLKDDCGYTAAKKSIRHAMGQFEGCSDEERFVLQHDLDQLQSMAEKLESGRIEIVVFGEISTGKSALINALVGSVVSEVNVQGGWTKEVWHVHWDGCGYRVPGFAHSEVVLVDTPGLNEVDGSQRGIMAQEAAARADLILFVTDSDLNETEYESLVQLASSHKPILLVLNKIDLYSSEEQERLLALFKSPRYARVIDPQNFLCASADPKAVEYLIESSEGTIRTEWRKVPSDVAGVRWKILEVLEKEGKALLALNGAMYAADKSDHIGAMRIRMREDRASKTIWSFAVMKAIAVAVNPLPAADVFAGSAMDVTMVATLARVYGITMTTTNARALVNSIFKAAGWVLFSEALAHVAAAIFKGLTLGYGTAITALPQGAAAGYGSYVVGQAARYYFEHGASWGQEAPKTVVTRILELTDRESVFRRLKVEIRKKIRLNPYARATDRCDGGTDRR